MKTFLAICTCAMISAGIYGFADMAHDVKNGTMISYDRGEGESSAAAGMLSKEMKVNKVKPMHYTAMPAAQKITLPAGLSDADHKATAVKKRVKPPVIIPAADSVAAEPAITATTDVKVDSVPQLDLPKEEFDYRDFSRGSPRKYKKKKH